jgi:hypothetical protein
VIWERPCSPPARSGVASEPGALVVPAGAGLVPPFPIEPAAGAAGAGAQQRYDDVIGNLPGLTSMITLVCPW